MGIQVWYPRCSLKLNVFVCDKHEKYIRTNQVVMQTGQMSVNQVGHSWCCKNGFVQMYRGGMLVLSIETCIGIEIRSKPINIREISLSLKCISALKWILYY